MLLFSYPTYLTNLVVANSVYFVVLKITIPIKYGQDKSRRPSRSRSRFVKKSEWPYRTLKIVEVSREKLREVGASLEKSRFNPTFPGVFDLKTAGKIEEKPNFPQLFVPKLGIAIPIPIPICLKVGVAIPILIPTHPNPIFVRILSPSRYLAHGWFPFTSDAVAISCIS